MTAPDHPGLRTRETWQKAIAAAPDLAPGAKLVALMLSVYVDESGGQGVWFGITDLVRLTGIPVPTSVRGYLEDLAALGWLRAETDRAGGTVRYLAWPKPAPPAFAMVPPREVPSEAAPSE